MKRTEPTDQKQKRLRPQEDESISFRGTTSIRFL